MTHDKKRLLSIGEAAKALEVTRRMILNYEDKGLILPDQRDGINGNRYYTADTVSRIRSIRILQNLGLSLDDIYAYYHGTTDLEPLIARLEDLRDEISRNIEKLKEHSKGLNDFEIRQNFPPRPFTARICIRQNLKTRKSNYVASSSRRSANMVLTPPSICFSPNTTFRIRAILPAASPSRRKAWVNISSPCPARKRSVSFITVPMKVFR